MQEKEFDDKLIQYTYNGTDDRSSSSARNSKSQILDIELITV